MTIGKWSSAPEKSFAGTAHTAIYAWLGLGSVMCVALVAGRGLHSHTHHFQTLVWNLIVSWIPLVLLALIYRAARRRAAARGRDAPDPRAGGARSDAAGRRGIPRDRPRPSPSNLAQAENHRIPVRTASLLAA